MKNENLTSMCILGSVAMMTMSSMTPCLAGVESSGGVETYKASPAWFMSLKSDRKIKTCTLISTDFGVDRATAESTLQLAFKKWGNYLINKRIQHLPDNYIGGHFIYITEMAMMTNCDGSEDLRVYFGEKNEEVIAAKLKYKKPFGFVERKTDPDLAWGKGFMYIATPSEISPAPAWTTPTHLMGVILHEVGHILGNDHLDGTIMASDVGELLQYMNSFQRLENIDGDRELRVCIECGMTYDGSLKDGSEYSANAAFKTLTGKDPISLSGVLFLKKEKGNPNGSHGPDYNLPEGTLVFIDQSKEYRFFVKSESLVSSNAIGVPLFSGKNGTFHSYGETFIGTLATLEDKTLPVVINLNSNRMAFEIQLMDHQHYPEKIFVSSWVNN